MANRTIRITVTDHIKFEVKVTYAKKEDGSPGIDILKVLVEHAYLLTDHGEISVFLQDENQYSNLCKHVRGKLEGNQNLINVINEQDKSSDQNLHIHRQDIRPQ